MLLNESLLNKHDRNSGTQQSTIAGLFARTYMQFFLSKMYTNYPDELHFPCF